MPKYEVEVCRINYAYAKVTVDAPSRKEAKKLGVGKAKTAMFGDDCVEYDIDSCEEID